MRIQKDLLSKYCKMVLSGEVDDSWDEYIKYQNSELQKKNDNVIDAFMQDIADEVLIDTLKKRGYTILKII